MILHEKQQQVKDELKKINVLVSGRRFGSSTLGRELVIERMDQGKRCLIASPVLRMASEYTREIRERCNREDSGFSVCSDYTLKQKKGVEPYDFIFVDVFQGFDDPEASYKEFLVLLKPEGQILIHFQPPLNGSDKPKYKFLKSLYLFGKYENKVYKSWQFSTFDSPFVDREQVENALLGLPASHLSEFCPQI